MHALYTGNRSQLPASGILRALSLHADFGVEREDNVVREYVGECNTATRALERRCSKLQRADQGGNRCQKWQFGMSATGTHNHLVNKNTQGPPVHGRGVPCAVDNFRGDVFYMSGGFVSDQNFLPIYPDNRVYDGGGMATHLQYPRKSLLEYLLCMIEYPEWGPDRVG